MDRKDVFPKIVYGLSFVQINKAHLKMPLELKTLWVNRIIAYLNYSEIEEQTGRMNLVSFDVLFD